MKLYVFIRSHYTGAFPKNELLDFIHGKIDFDLKSLHKDLLVFVPKFARREVSSRLS